MFDAICGGGSKPKSVAKLMELTGYNQVEVSQLAGKLADQQLVHKTKVGPNTLCKRSILRCEPSKDFGFCDQSEHR
jgi:hypothetical protein